MQISLLIAAVAANTVAELTAALDCARAASLIDEDVWELLYRRLIKPRWLALRWRFAALAPLDYYSPQTSPRLLSRRTSSSRLL